MEFWIIHSIYIAIDNILLSSPCSILIETYGFLPTIDFLISHLPTHMINKAKICLDNEASSVSSRETA